MGEQPWAGVRANEVSTKVSRGQRTQLSLDLVNLDGCEELDEMVQLLWAQDPTVRPPLRDVARRLRGISPPLPLPPPTLAKGSTRWCSSCRRKTQRSDLR